MSLRRPLILALLALACSAPPTVAAADPVADGGFETPVVDALTTLATPAALGGWSVDAGSVQLADASSWAPAAGDQSIRMGDGGGALSQTVPVEAGRRYRLSLRHADGPVAGGGFISCGSVAGEVMPLEVTWDGATVATIPQGPGQLTDDWQTFSTLVTAAAATGRIALVSDGSGFPRCGMNVDDVTLASPAASETATALSASTASAVTGQPVTFTATVIGGDPATVPAGSVRFSVDGTPAGTPVPLDSAGQAKLTTGTLAVGDHSIGAGFTPAAGTSFDPGAAGPVAVAIARAHTTTSETIVPDPTVAGQDATFTATVRVAAPGAGTPTGTVQFRDDDGTPIGEPEPLGRDGTARIVSSAGAGEYRVHAEYGGDAGFEPSATAVRQAVRRTPTITTLSSSANPVRAGGTVKFTIGVAPKPPGDAPLFGAVTITVDGHPAGPPIPMMGFDTLVVTATAPGNATRDVIRAAYGGDGNTEPSSASLTQVVTAASSPGTPLGTRVPGQPATVSRADLSRLVSGLTRRLQRRGLKALAGGRETLTAAEPGRLTQKVYAAPGRGAAARASVLLASGRHRFATAGPGTLRLRVTQGGRRAIRRATLRAVRIVTRFQPATGPAVTVTRRVTLRPRRPAGLSGAAARGWHVSLDRRHGRRRSGAPRHTARR